MIFLSFLISCILSFAFASSPQRVAVEKLALNYQTEIQARYTSDLKITYMAGDDMQASAGLFKGEPQLHIFDGFLANLSEVEVALTVCHELGHFLGAISYSEVTGDHSQEIHTLSVEGEADYFSGQCFKDFYSNQPQILNQAVAHATALQEKIMSEKVDIADSANEIFDGIRSGYPSPSCRVRSFMSGFDGAARPRCWYNP